MRAAIAPIMPAARIIDALWAMSSGPNHAGLTTRTRVISGTNRTLTAPRPSMTTASEAIVVERSREWATRERPSVRLAKMPGVGAGAGAAVASAEVEAGVAAGLGVIRPTTAGRPRIRTNEARNDSPSSTNAGQNTPARPMISPARPAPTIPAMTRVAWATEFAASRPSRGTTFGMTAPRAGAKNVPMLDWTNANRNSSQSLSALPTRTKPRTTIARSRSEASMIRRRSARST